MISRRNFITLTLLAASSQGFSLGVSPEQGNAPVGVLFVVPPTRQKVLDGSILEGVFMDTGMGRPESGMFGNVRKYSDGSPRFHEGIDIAPIAPWSRRRQPTDLVCAVAAGRVVHINRKGSLYGNYVVLTHPVPGVGEVYSLYAHLRRIEPTLHVGDRAVAGMVLGIMGNTPDIPVARAHCHFELGLMMNRFYPLIDDEHGIWNGANLYGINPCKAFAERSFDFLSYLKNHARAFSVVIPRPRHRPEYFDRYPCFWYGNVFDATTPTVIDFSFEGIPLRGENYYVPPGESTPQAPYVLSSNAVEMAKGRAFVRRGKLTSRGKDLLDNLYVSPTDLRGKSLGEVG
ncbi:MAG: M23 family metallopeptidase [Kiritimatiellia bacterium]